jgi:hypothetical protein
MGGDALRIRFRGVNEAVGSVASVEAGAIGGTVGDALRIRFRGVNGAVVSVASVEARLIGGAVGDALRVRLRGVTAAGASMTSSAAVVSRLRPLVEDLGFAEGVFLERRDTAAFFLEDDSFDFIAHYSS